VVRRGVAAEQAGVGDVLDVPHDSLPAFVLALIYAKLALM
jgi:hypothetical protein